MKYENPVIKGFYPDPSVCKVKNKYYLVTSSFQYFPGIPLFESSDLVNWKQIGYCLTRKSQLDLDGIPSSCGIFAPTIRYHNDRFYVTSRNIGARDGKNFYVYADDIYAEWSDPIEVNQEGIDSSFYFEDDRAYFMSNGVSSTGQAAIIQCEIDLKTGIKLTESIPIWYGTGGRHLEAPHIYKINDYYYIVAAEGGTEYGHMVVYARSNSVWGPFEQYPKNPVLTNRDLGTYVIQGVGHADLLQDKNGNWWAMHLGFRQVDQYTQCHHLGRETFLMPVSFSDDGWFTIGNGTVPLLVDTNKLSDKILQKYQKNNTFSSIISNNEWRYIRENNKDNYVFDGTILKIKSSDYTLDDIGGKPSFIGINQKDFKLELSVTVELNDGEAGVTLYMDENHHYDLFLQSNDDKNRVILKLNVGNIKHSQNKVTSQIPNKVTFTIVASADEYQFFYKNKDAKKILLGIGKTRYLSSEVAGGFTGVVIGLFSQNGKKNRYNTFSDFKCQYR